MESCFKCVVCLDVVPPPWLLCLNGHVYCEDCFIVNNTAGQCAICNASDLYRARALPLEHMAALLDIKATCPHAGCNFAASMADPTTLGHRNVCAYRPMRCPLDSACPWRGTATTLVQEHAATEHAKLWRASAPPAACKRNSSDLHVIGRFQYPVCEDGEQCRGDIDHTLAMKIVNPDNDAYRAFIWITFESDEMGTNYYHSCMAKAMLFIRDTAGCYRPVTNNREMHLRVYLTHSGRVSELYVRHWSYFEYYGKIRRVPSIISCGHTDRVFVPYALNEMMTLMVRWCTSS